MIFFGFSVSVFADPIPPTSVIYGENRPFIGGTGESASGNATELIFNDLQVTLSWQGYYGNISGNMTLENAAGQLFYFWEGIPISGEVYASNQSAVSWNNIECVNLTANSSQELNESDLNAMFGMDEEDFDRFGKTFNETYTGSFMVGPRLISAASFCPMVRLHNGSNTGSDNWREVLLTDNLTNSVIFAAVIQEDTNAFDNSSRDFQMLVAADKDESVIIPMLYYFFLELG